MTPDVLTLQQENIDSTLQDMGIRKNTKRNNTSFAWKRRPAIDK